MDYKAMLKPCAHCGAEAEMRHGGVICSAHCWSPGWPTPEEWNRRALSPIDKLKDAVIGEVRHLRDWKERKIAADGYDPEQLINTLAALDAAESRRK